MNDYLTRESFWRPLHGIDTDGSESKEPSGADVVQELSLHLAPELDRAQLPARRIRPAA